MIPRTSVYDTYWHFAAERQKIFFNKLKGEEAPWTDDPILQEYKFCNAYRASDRVSQFLIRNVIYSPKSLNERDTLFRILLFRLLNRSETWQALEKTVGPVTFSKKMLRKYDQELLRVKESGIIYGNAFIIPSASTFGHQYKHQNLLALLDETLTSKSAGLILTAKSLEGLYQELLQLPSIGPFLAYQLAIDLNYSELFDFDENDFTVAGPGAQRGIQKVFKESGGKSDEEVIMWMVENQEREFARLGIDFKDLWGRQLKAIDCQCLFCETDKYSRVRFPRLVSNRSRIKSTYNPKKKSIEYFYPPKWGINDLVVQD